MSEINNLNKINLKHYLISFLIITIIFLLLGFGSINLIKKYVYQNKEEESIKIANSYSLGLNKAEEAVELTKNILSEKLLYSSRAAALYKDDYADKLDQLAAELNVDVIYYYNNQAEITASSDSRYIGWQAGEEHPVYNFFQSSEQKRVGPIRADTESGIFYKYSYYRAKDGTIIQLGIKAEKIQDFISSFDINNLLEEIVASSESTEISYLNSNLLVEAATDPAVLYEQIDDPKIIKRLEKNQSYSTPIEGEESSYFYTITAVDGLNKGYLAIKYPLQKTQALISYLKRFIFIIFIIIYSFFSLSFYNLYQKNKKLQQNFYYDNLSKLPKKNYLWELIAEKIDKGAEASLFLINFDNLSLINMTYGYEYGDQFIKTIAAKLESAADSRTQVFRFSAAKFAIYFDGLTAEEKLIEKAEEINHLFDKTLLLGELDREYFKLNIGIETIADNYYNVEDIFRNITIALKSAQKSASFYSFFDCQVKNELKKDKIIEKELKKALLEDDQQKFYLEFQPFYEQKNGEIIGFEALARFKSESYGSISPAKFIKIAEKRQLIMRLSELVLKRAASFSKKLKKAGFKDLKISVNLSVIDVIQDNFSSKVIKIIRENGAQVENFILEITESLFLENFKITNKKLQQLQQHQIKIALDDFGKGYSSFYRFKELNIDILKIDKDFIQKIADFKTETLMVPSIIEMGHKLGLIVIAEGVEKEAEKSFLIENNCDFMQGYLFSPPLKEAKALKLLKSFND